MANIVTTADFVGVAKVTANSAQTDFPVTEIVDYAHPARPYKATAAGTAENVVFDFGAATAITDVFVDNTNVNTIRVQGNATDSWATPTYGATVTVAQDAYDGRYKYHLRSAGAALFTLRFARLVCGTATTTDSAVGWSVGAVSFCSASTTWTLNPGFPLTITTVTPTLDGLDPVKVGNQYAEIMLAQSKASATYVSELQTVVRYGEHAPFILSLQNSSNEDSYMVRRVGSVNVAKAGPAHYDVARVLLRECR